MQKDLLKNIALNLPTKPGVYQFYDKEGQIIYVGKAKNLKNRVNSYFNKNNVSAKTELLIRKIHNIKYIIVETETDAFLLENNLIKKHKPKYNIQLKDDKSFPWIVISKEEFPQVYYTRHLKKDQSEYFGPFTSTYLVRTMIDMFQNIFGIRTCKLALTTETINNKKYKACLQYHLKNCYGACISQQSYSEYNENIEQIRKILKGNIKVVIDYIKDKMLKAADAMNFELAEEYKNKSKILENYQSKSTIINSSQKNIDVFSIFSKNNYAYVNFIKFIEGKIMQFYSVEIKKRLEETDKEILERVILEIRSNIQQGISTSKEIIVPFEVDLDIKNIEFKIPQKGIKKELLELSKKNLKFYYLDKIRQRSETSPTKQSNELILKMQADLNLSRLPEHIECFDNSNIQGTNPVAACVVFINGKPCKKRYRKFNIKTVVGANDFASMSEVVFRRYDRMLKENQTLPQLIIIDGGKGQLSSAVESLESLKITDKVEIISIAKRLEEIYRPNDPYPLYLDKNSTTLRIIQHARDEAHRFGITFHRQKRSKKMIKTEITEIKGIGDKTMQKLLKHFGSLSVIKTSSLEELSKIVGNAKAKIIHSNFNKKQK